MANQETQGVDVGLYAPVSGTPTLVAAKRGLEFEETADTIDIGHADNYGWMERLYGQQEYSVDWDGVMLLDDSSGSFAASHKALRDAKRNGNIIAVEVRYPFGVPSDSGDALVTSITLSAPYDAEATISVSLESTGAIS